MVAVSTGSAPPVPSAWWDRFEPPEGYRAEVIRGELVVTPAPTNEHQHVVMQVGIMLWAAIRATVPSEYVILPGAAWRLDARGLVAQAPEPDLVVRRRERGRHQDEPPVLAIEVVSPSDGYRLSDGLTRIEGKRADYAAHGLNDYVELEPHGGGYTARRYELVGATLVVADVVGVGDTLVAGRPFPYEVSLAGLTL
jgi:Uma2 family endonuclease